MSNKRIFILDTNILVEMSNSLAGVKDAKQKAVNKFMNSHKNQIKIPDLVYAEFAAFFFQKGIPFENYSAWHDKRLSAFMQIYKQLRNCKTEIIKSNELKSTAGYCYIEIARNLSLLKLSDTYISSRYQKEKARLENAKNQMDSNNANINAGRDDFIRRQEKYLKSAKMLDGMDSQILAISILYALNKKETDVTIVTFDKCFESASNHICRNINNYKMSGLSEDQFSLNTMNVFDIINHL